MMNKAKIFLAVAMLVLASLACQTLMGGSPEAPNVPATEDSGGSTTPGGDSGSGSSVEDLPKPDDAEILISEGNTISLQTKLSLDDTMAYYRDEFGKLGYQEDSTFTVTSDTTFSMVFTGHESGKKLVVQGVDFGGSTTVTVTLQDF